MVGDFSASCSKTPLPSSSRGYWDDVFPCGERCKKSKRNGSGLLLLGYVDMLALFGLHIVEIGGKSLCWIALSKKEWQQQV